MEEGLDRVLKYQLSVKFSVIYRYWVVKISGLTYPEVIKNPNRDNSQLSVPRIGTDEEKKRKKQKDALLGPSFFKKINLFLKNQVNRLNKQICN